ncbi:AAA family ATPase [Nitrogeniibacter mangrovi]|uniref:AAA family ATPase n=1 Tax=Nitrogeniibacter mangrovi TaxID=2016596 RepID=A0A6C1B740_9RHOO|nr:XrtA/PEP-CTERM system-associated ATPase [Nitrogeniibacter mangrovi]QID18548.1 AAA family ATPase [Nitrogeniibacter mangrovi]
MYESYYKLSGKPFQLNPDPAFFFGSRGHKRAMAYLEYGLHQNEGFIVITGEIGAGKTTLVRSLLQKLDPAKVVAAQLVSTQIDADDILRLVAAAFGVPSKNLDKADLLLALETFLVSATASGKRALLVVDEAQNLTPRAVEELRMLSNFQLEDHALLQSFLIGQPEFRDIMQSPEMQQLRQRVIASYHLGPLDVEETKSYIEHRLKHVGWHPDSPSFSADAFEAIYRASGGIPRRINTLCDRLLLAGFLGEKLALTAREVDEVAAEMKEEQRSGRRASTARLVAAKTTENVAPAATGVGLDPLDGIGDPAVAAQFARLAEGFDAARIEARLGHLEQTVSTVLQLMNQILSSEDGPDQDKAVK